MTDFAALTKQIDDNQQAQAVFETELRKRWEEEDKNKGLYVRGETLAKTQKISEHLTWIEEKRDELVKTIDRVAAIETTLKRREKGLGTNGKTQSEAEVEYGRRFDNYLRYPGQEIEVPKELIAERKAALPERMRDGLDAKALSIGIDPSGGYFTTAEIDSEMNRYITERSPMESIATVTTGTAHSLIRRQRTRRLTIGGWVSETGTRAVDATTPQVGQIELVAHEHFTQPAATQTELEDPGFNSEEWLMNEATDELLLEAQTSYVVGTANGQPQGFTTYASGTSYELGQMERQNVGDPVDSEGLIAIQDQLLEPFQANATWTMRRAIKTLIRQIRDESGGAGTGQFMLVPDFSLRGATSLLGSPIVMMADMAAAGSGLLILAYGDFRQGYRIYRRRGISVLRDPYTNKPFVNFYVTERVGGGSLNTEAIKIGVQT